MAERDAAVAALRAAGGQEKPTDPRIGFSVWLDREQWGLVGDGLMAQRELLLERKRINSESTADLSADAVADVLRLLNAADPITGSAAPVGGQAEPSDAQTCWACDGKGALVGESCPQCLGCGHLPPSAVSGKRR